MRMVKEEASPGAYVHHPASCTLDTNSYAWVKDYLKDKNLREEAAALEAEILSTQNSLIDRDELKKRFEGERVAIKQEFLGLTAASLSQVQGRHGNLFDNVIPQQLRLVPLIFLGQEDIDKIFSSLPKGTTQREIDLRVRGLLKRIEELNLEIDRDLSPKSRWYHTPDGSRESYPRGCRWLEFTNSWRETASRYSEAVNHEGERLKTEAEHMAWKLLEFDKLSKPYILREPQL